MENVSSWLNLKSKPNKCIIYHVYKLFRINVLVVPRGATLWYKYIIFTHTESRYVKSFQIPTCMLVIHKQVEPIHEAHNNMPIANARIFYTD